MNSCTLSSIDSSEFHDLPNYVRGFLTGGSYEAIPLEINAYTLEGRFHADQKKQFPVAAEVALTFFRTRCSAGKASTDSSF